MTTPYVDLNTIHTPSSGGIPPVAWGTDIRLNFELMAKPPGCIVARAAALSVVNSTDTAVPWTDTDVRDTDAYHDTSTNNNRLTVPSGLGGLYFAFANLGFAANATGGRNFSLRKNGTTSLILTNQQVNSAAGSTRVLISGFIILAAGDYIETIVTQFSGSNLNTDTTLTAGLIWQGIS